MRKNGVKRNFLRNARNVLKRVAPVMTVFIISGIIAGCSCADDPTPVDTTTEYCELQLEIDRESAETRVILLPN